MVLGVAFQAGDFSSGHAIGEVQAAIVVGGKDSGLVAGEHQLLTLDGHLVSTMVVGVLLVDHGAVVVPLGQHVSAAAHEVLTGIQSPCTGVVAFRISSFHSFLIDREVGGEGAQIQEVSSGGCQLDSQSLAILGSGDSQGSIGVDQVTIGIHLGHLSIALDGSKHVSIVRSSSGIHSTIPGVDKVAGIQSIAVGPLQVVLQGEGVGQAVVRHGVALSQVGNLLLLGIIGEQAGEGVDGQDSAVNSAVQSGIQLVRLGSQVHPQGVAAIAQLGEHEVLVAEGSPVDVGQVVLLQIDISVEVQGQQGAGIHQDILSLMHQVDTLDRISAGTDLLDQRIVSIPTVDRINEIGFDCFGFLSSGLSRFGSRGSGFRAGSLSAASDETEAHDQRQEKCGQLFHRFFLHKIFGLSPFIKPQQGQKPCCNLSDKIAETYLFQQATMCPFPRSVKAGRSAAHCSVA